MYYWRSFSFTSVNSPFFASRFVNASAVLRFTTRPANHMAVIPLPISTTTTTTAKTTTTTAKTTTTTTTTTTITATSKTTTNTTTAKTTTTDTTTAKTRGDTTIPKTTLGTATAKTRKTGHGHASTRTRDDGSWVRRQGQFLLFVYSAFYDDRSTLATPAVVRVIVVSQDVTKHPVYCKLLYANGTTVVVPVRALPIGAGVYKFGTKLMEYVYSCALRSPGAPASVSIVDAPTDPTGFLVGVEVPARTSRKRAFAVCVSVAYWQHDPYRIVEWMELQRLWGVERVTVYNNSLAAPSAAVFRHYADEGFVDFRQSHNFVHDGSETAIHLHMSPVINDCMYRNMHRFEKIVVVDLDEMIVPRQHGSLAAMLAAVDGVTSRGATSHRSYTFRNIYFFLDQPPDERMSRHLATMRYRRRLPPSPEGVSIKSIIDPQECTNMHNHYCWGYTAKAHTTIGGEIAVDPKIAANQHYKKCHFDSYNRKIGMCAAILQNVTNDDTMLRFKEPLIRSVNVQLRKLKMEIITWSLRQI